jgi:hypothetical protein
MTTAATDLLLAPQANWWRMLWFLPWYLTCGAALTWAVAGLGGHRQTAHRLRQGEGFRGVGGSGDGEGQDGEESDGQAAPHGVEHGPLITTRQGALSASR